MGKLAVLHGPSALSTIGAFRRLTPPWLTGDNQGPLLMAALFFLHADE
jgi:hypothetical protein